MSLTVLFVQNLLDSGYGCSRVLPQSLNPKPCLNPRQARFRTGRARIALEECAKRRPSILSTDRAFAVKVVPQRLPVFPFSGPLKGCKGHKTHRFENGGTNQIRKTGKREVVLGQPLLQTL